MIYMIAFFKGVLSVLFVRYGCQERTGCSSCSPFFASSRYLVYGGRGWDGPTWGEKIGTHFFCGGHPGFRDASFFFKYVLPQNKIEPKGVDASKLIEL